MTMGLFTVFTAGLLTFLTPCVLPLVPIYLTALIGGDIRSLEKNQKGRLLIRAAFFSIGFISVFTLLGLGASSIGVFLEDHRAALQISGAVLVGIFALKFLGIIRIPFLDRIAKADDSKMTTRFGWVNAFIMGVVFAAGWSPCVGPVLGTVLTYTATNTSSPLQGAGYLTIYGLGFALPLMIAAVFAEAATKFIRGISRHLPKIERATGVLMLVVAGFLAMGAYDDFKASSAQNAPGLTELLEKDGNKQAITLPAMVELYSKDCTICEHMKPIVEGIVTQCDQRGVKVIALDISDDRYRHLVDQYRIVGVPTFLFLDKTGHETARLIGQQTEGTLKQALSALRGERCPGLALVKDIKNENPLAFPEQEEEETASCHSTTISATNVTKNSKSSEKPQTQTKSSVQPATSPQGSCSRGLQ